jgi:hypothetical protein
VLERSLGESGPVVVAQILGTGSQMIPAGCRLLPGSLPVAAACPHSP